MERSKKKVTNHVIYHKLKLIIEKL